MTKKKLVKVGTGHTTPLSDTKPQTIKVDYRPIRLAEITSLVQANNQSTLSTELIVCQIYMESRFDKNAHAQGSSAKGLMQLLKAPVRELYRLENLKKPPKEREAESALYRKADDFHDGPNLSDEATNIQIGTRYLQRLVDKHSGAADGQGCLGASQVGNQCHDRQSRQGQRVANYLSRIGHLRQHLCGDE